MGFVLVLSLLYEFCRRDTQCLSQNYNDAIDYRCANNSPKIVHIAVTNIPTDPEAKKSDTKVRAQ